MSGVPTTNIQSFTPSLKRLNGQNVGELERKSVEAAYDHNSATTVFTNYLDSLIKGLLPVKGKTEGELQATIADTATNLAKYSFAAMQSLKEAGDDENKIIGMLNRDIASLAKQALGHVNKSLRSADKLKIEGDGGNYPALRNLMLTELRKPPAPVSEKAAGAADGNSHAGENTADGVATSEASTDEATQAQGTSAAAETEGVSPETTAQGPSPSIDQVLDEFAEGIQNPANGMTQLTDAFNKAPVALLKLLAKVQLPAGDEAAKAAQYLMTKSGENLTAVKSFIDENIGAKNFSKKLEQLAQSEPEKAAAVKVYLKHLEQHLGEYGTINLTRGLNSAFSETTGGILGGLKKFLPESIQAQIANGTGLEDALSTVEGLQGNPAKTLELVKDFRDEIRAAEKLKPGEQENPKQAASKTFLEKVRAAVENGELNAKDVAVINMAVLGNHEIKDKQDKDILEQMKTTLEEKFNIKGIDKEQVLKFAGMGLSAIVAVGMFFPGLTHGIMGMAGGLVQMGGMALVGKLFGGENGGGFADVLKFQAMNYIGDFGQGKSAE